MRQPELRASFDSDELEAFKVILVNEIARPIANDVALRANVVRFLARVDSSGDGCWPWLGSRLRRPNGDLSSGTHSAFKANVLAHRFSYLLHCGPITDGLVVRHECDNVACVRPAHLLPGSQADNLRDMTERGRRAPIQVRFGEDHPRAKLTADGARSIVARRAAGEPLANIAADLGLTLGTLHEVLNGEAWSAATGAVPHRRGAYVARDVTIGGRTQSLRAWALEMGRDYKLVHARVRRGEEPAKALSRPARPIRRGAA